MHGPGGPSAGARGKPGARSGENSWGECTICLGAVRAAVAVARERGARKGGAGAGGRQVYMCSVVICSDLCYMLAVLWPLLRCE